ncbi:MAG: HIT family protein [Nocardioidaceae bacterium]
MPLLAPTQVPCSYCENFAGRQPWHGPPAVVYEDETTSVFLAPASLGGMEGHTLVVPRRHVETVFDLSPEEESTLFHAVTRVAKAVRAAFDPDGVLLEQRNGVAADQTVPHVHFHVIPRRAGTPFPPRQWVEITPAEERAVLAQRLRQHWDEQ